MNRLEAQRMAEQLMRFHLDASWRFEWVNTEGPLGTCRYDTRTIELSLPHTLARPESDVRDTVLHEIAHALAPPNIGHGPEWQDLAESIGATPRARSPVYAPPVPCSDQDLVEEPAAVLNRAGVRLMLIDGKRTAGVWSDLDCAEIRQALRSCGDSPVCYLDGSGVPARYKLRRVEGEPVPMNVLAEMEAHPDEPWKVRDRLLKRMNCRRFHIENGSDPKVAGASANLNGRMVRPFTASPDQGADPSNRSGSSIEKVKQYELYDGKPQYYMD